MKITEGICKRKYYCTFSALKPAFCKASLIFNLTDEDGPYIELMCGVYTDNQPDFAWMHPYEEKSFRQYFMPYYNVGMVKNATKEALLNLEMEDEKARLKIYVTANYPNSVVTLHGEATVFFEETVNLSPRQGFEQLISVNGTAYEKLIATVKDQHGNVLVSWSPSTISAGEIPEPAKAAKEPKDIQSVEELYLQGLHLEQYRHATFDPTAYYREALAREPGDVRNNNAMGLWYLKKGQFEKALAHFDAAIQTLTCRNPNPYDGESYFNRGVALNYLGRKEEAYAAFYKSCWNAAWQGAGYFHLAQIDGSRGNLDKALELVEKSLIKNWHHHKARHLKIIMLRKLGRTEEAKRWVEDSLAIDRFNFGAWYEKYILSGNQEDLATFRELLRDNPHNYIEFSLDYAQGGQWDQAIALLNVYAEGRAQMYPMVLYFLGWYYEQRNDTAQAEKMYKKVQEMPPDYCFPNRLEEVVVLQAACARNPQDACSPYYLGNFWYAAKQYEAAQQCWEASVKLDDTHAICHRNLALLYFNKTNQQDLARTHLEYAFSLDPTDARLLMELDLLYKKINVPIDQRLALLKEHSKLTHSRDDLYLEWVALHNFKGNFEEALRLIQRRQFHPWEGGEGKVPFQYITVRVELAKSCLHAGEYDQAIEHLQAAQVYPHNLGEGKLFGAQENDIHYWLGCAYAGQGKDALAQASWKKASKGLSNPSPAIFYNDPQPDKIFYQGLALLKLGRKAEAAVRFHNLIDYGEKHLNDKVTLDYFAISLPDLLIWEEDLNVRNAIHCHYLIGLGELGLGNTEGAKKALQEVIRQDVYYLPAHLHLKMVSAEAQHFSKT